MNYLSVAQSKKIGSESYVYRMRYWGKVFFTARRVRIKGRFAGSIITVTEFQFDEENFYNWLQHQAPIEHKDTRSNVPDPRYKPQSIKMGFFKVKAKSGLWAVADASGNPIGDEWFKDITSMRKSAKGEILTIVNKDGWAYAYYPNRDKKQRLVPMNKTYSNVITESKLRNIISEALKTVLNESYSTSRVGKYIVVLGDNQPHSIEGLENYRNNLYDVAMYNSKEEHICVFSIGRNTKKFICCNLEYDKDYGEWLGFTPIKSYDVPTLIRQDLRVRFTNS